MCTGMNDRDRREYLPRSGSVSVHDGGTECLYTPHMCAYHISRVCVYSEETGSRVVVTCYDWDFADAHDFMGRSEA